MIVNKTSKIVRTDSTCMELNAADVLELLRRAGHNVPASMDSCDLRVYFAVPGGGDWSSMDLDISDKYPLRVEWKTAEERDA